MRNFVAKALLLSSLAAVSAMAEGLFIGGEGGARARAGGGRGAPIAM